MGKVFGICALGLFALLLSTSANALDRGAALKAYKEAEIGDWVEYNTVSKMGTAAYLMKIKTTVVAKDAESVTVEIQMTRDEKVHSVNKRKMVFKELEDAMKNPPKIEEIGKGDEKVTVGEKVYACKWIEAKATVPNMGDTVNKVWISTDVPLGGMVKRTSKNKMMTSTMDLIGCGRGK